MPGTLDSKLNVLPVEAEKWPSEKNEQYQKVMDLVLSLGQEIKILNKENHDDLFPGEPKFRKNHEDICSMVPALRSHLVQSILLLDTWGNELKSQAKSYADNVRDRDGIKLPKQENIG